MKFERFRHEVIEKVKRIGEKLASLDNPPVPERRKMISGEFTPGEVDEMKDVITAVLGKFGSKRKRADAANFFKEEIKGDVDIPFATPALADIFDKMAFDFGEHRVWEGKSEITIEDVKSVLQGYLKRRHGIEIESH